MFKFFEDTKYMTLILESTDKNIFEKYNICNKVESLTKNILTLNQFTIINIQKLTNFHVN